MTKPQPDTDSGLVQATKALGAAMEKYRKAAEIARIAAGEAAVALSDLNECQERVDTAIDEMKKAAPEDSRWRYPPGR